MIFSEPLTNGNHDQPAEQEEEVPSSVPLKETLNAVQQEESPSESEDEDDVADNQEMVQPATHVATTTMHSTSTTTGSENITAGNRKRGRKGIDDAIAGAILHMAAASRLRTAAIKRISERYSVADCVKELDAMQGVEEGVYFAALDLFDSPNAREIFLSLKGEKRMIWLLCKCNANQVS